MHYYAYALQRAFSILDRTPRFVIMIISGAVASIAMRLLHKPAPAAFWIAGIEDEDDDVALVDDFMQSADVVSA